MKTYYEKLKDPRWQKKRLEIMERDNFTCQSCGDTESTLNVHHRYYVSKRDPWDYQQHCYQTLCSKCHNAEHDEGEKITELPFESALLFLYDATDSDECCIFDVTSMIARASKCVKDKDAFYGELLHWLAEKEQE